MLNLIGIFLLKQFVEFIRLTIGTMQRPYQAYRLISLKPNYFQLLFIAILITTYLILSTLARDGLRSNPLFLTTSLVKVGTFVSLGFIVIALLLYQSGKIFGGKGKLSTFFLLWAFSLLPTLCWFLFSTIFYLLIPPPRTVSLQGQLFSAFFLVFSLSCFFWKGILYYLTLRIGLHLNTLKIVAMSVIALPIGFLGSLLAYKLGIFKVPFI